MKVGAEESTKRGEQTLGGKGSSSVYKITSGVATVRIDSSAIGCWRRTCEICGATAINVAGEQSNQESNASAHSQTTAGQTQTETRGTWHGRCVMNFLLAAMIFAFILSSAFFGI
ncbi:hypothetical protein Bca52824_076992 [Brassica carinata]|uniref:Uncharacterized protein n=1 Tax=Brassica carinata TaxID=52824 RepID=A0A8X7PV30_BRACI|nr:hypothetical protein Bca52824_076992 [Brassica carinata]